MADIGCDINIPDRYGRTVLHLAIQRNLNTIVLDLIEKGANIDYQDKKRNTPLHYALKFSNVEALCMLLAYGADVSLAEYAGCPPFLYAVRSNEIEMAEILYDYYDDFDAVDRSNYNALQYAIPYSKTFALRLIESGINVNVDNFCGTSPIELAIKYMQFDVLRVLWWKIDYKKLLDLSDSVLWLYIKLIWPVNVKEIIEMLYWILECETAHQLLEGCYSPVVDSNFYCRLLVFLYKNNVLKKDRINIIRILLSLGMEIILRDIDYTLRMYNYDEEVELLLSVTGEVQTTKATNHVLLLSIIGVKHFDRNCIKDMCVERYTNEAIHLQLKGIGRSLKYFSCPLELKQQIASRFPSQVETLSSNPNLPSLLELSRNQSHKCIREFFNITKAYQFQEVIRNLQIPRVIQDIIKFRRPIYDC